jgi:hypothetical protein
MSAALQRLELHRRLLHKKRAPFDEIAVEEALAAAGGLFCDHFFPPIAESIGSRVGDDEVVWRRPADFIAFESEVRSSRRTSLRRRPSGIVEVFDDGIEAHDIAQGALGNCWFLCSLGAICEFPHLVDRLFCREWSKDDRSIVGRSCDVGVYALRFCVDGAWRRVIVDDQFPCSAHDGKPVFSKAHGHEIWVLLVEKAYAKLQGSYHACRIGDPAEGLRDLTGAPTIKLLFERDAVTFDDIWSWDRNDCILCASTPGVDTLTEGGKSSAGEHGLVPGHAYTVVQARRIQRDGPHKGAEVLQLRNPWGSFEWGGAWSDASVELNACRAELEDDGVETNSSVGDDGMFWMCFADFKRSFISMSVCAPHLFQPGSTLSHPSKLQSTPQPSDALHADAKPDSRRYVPPRLDRADGELEEWYEVHRKSRFEPGASEGSARSGGSVLHPAHCFMFEVPPLGERQREGAPPPAAQVQQEEQRAAAARDGPLRQAHARCERVSCFFTLSQPDTRDSSAFGYVDVGLTLLRVGGGGGGGGSGVEEVGYTALNAGRNLVLEAYLPAGTYALVPLTGGCRPQPPEREDHFAQFEPYRHPEACALSTHLQQAIAQLVYLLDEDMDGRLGREDLSTAQAASFVEAAKIDLARRGDRGRPDAILRVSDVEPHGLSCEHIELALLEAWGPGPSAGWDGLLKAVGYEPRTLRPSRGASIPFAVSMHSSQPLGMRCAPLPPLLADATLCHVAKRHGRPRRLGACSLVALTSGTGCVFVAENLAPAPTSLTVDCAGSRNMQTSRGSLTHTADVPGTPPGHPAVPTLVMSLTATQPDEAFQWQYKCKTTMGVGTATASVTSSPTLVGPPDLTGCFQALASGLPVPSESLCPERQPLAVAPASAHTPDVLRGTGRPPPRVGHRGADVCDPYAAYALPRGMPTFAFMASSAIRAIRSKPPPPDSTYPSVDDTTRETHEVREDEPRAPWSGPNINNINKPLRACSSTPAVDGCTVQ